MNKSKSNVRTSDRIRMELCRDGLERCTTGDRQAAGMPPSAGWFESRLAARIVAFHLTQQWMRDRHLN